MEMKYIRGRIGFAIFDASQNHSDIARGMSSKPESAGKCTIAVGHKIYSDEKGDDDTYVSVHCYGASDALGIGSRGEDGTYLEKQISRY